MNIYVLHVQQVHAGKLLRTSGFSDSRRRLGVPVISFESLAKHERSTSACLQVRAPHPTLFPHGQRGADNPASLRPRIAGIARTWSPSGSASVAASSRRQTRQPGRPGSQADQAAKQTRQPGSQLTIRPASQAKMQLELEKGDLLFAEGALEQETGWMWSNPAGKRVAEGKAATRRASVPAYCCS